MQNSKLYCRGTVYPCPYNIYILICHGSTSLTTSFDFFCLRQIPACRRHGTVGRDFLIFLQAKKLQAKKLQAKKLQAFI